MLSEMKPYHLWCIVCGLLCLYALLIYPLMVVDNNNTSLTNSGTTTSTASPLHIRTKYYDKENSMNNISMITKKDTKLFRKRSQYVYKEYANLVGWSSDFHISTVKDIKDILLKFKVTMIDKSLSGHCHLTNTCEEDLRVINKQNGITLSSCPNRLRHQFYEEYKDDEELLSVDFFLCTHASSMCELFMPFGKPIIVIASTRYEIGRHEKHQWMEWNENLALIMSKSPAAAAAAAAAALSGGGGGDKVNKHDSNIVSTHEKKNRDIDYKHRSGNSGSDGITTEISHYANVVGANNKYDQEYMQYFTGLKGIELFPSLCETFSEDDSSVPVTYHPARSEILIAPSRDVNEALAAELIATAAGRGFSFAGGLFSAFMEMTGLATATTGSDGSSTGYNGQNYPNNAKETPKLDPKPRPTYAVKHIRDLYPHFKYTDLAAHPAVVIIPYQISFMLFFELYYMNMPMFVPSPALLTQWHLTHQVRNRRITVTSLTYILVLHAYI